MNGSFNINSVNTEEKEQAFKDTFFGDETWAKPSKFERWRDKSSNKGLMTPNERMKSYSEDYTTHGESLTSEKILRDVLGALYSTVFKSKKENEKAESPADDYNIGKMGEFPWTTSAPQARPDPFTYKEGPSFTRDKSHMSFGVLMGKYENGAAAGENPYDALFSSAEKQDQFKDIKVSEMSMQEVLNFTKVDGDYAKYVQKVNPEKEKASPVGFYQFLGSTIDDIVKRSDIFKDEKGKQVDLTKVKFSPEIQNKMFNWYMNDRTRGVWERKALLKAIRLGWSGLKKAPDQDIIDAWQEWHSYGVPTRTKGN